MDRKIVAIVLLADTPMPGFEHLLCKEAMPEGGFSSTKVANITQEITDKYVKINLFVLFFLLRLFASIFRALNAQFTLRFF